MYHFTVTIPNQQLAIQRHFNFAESAAALSFEGWLKERGLTFTLRSELPDTLQDAIRAIEWEIRLSATGRVE